MVIPSACYEMDTSLDGAWWVGAAAAVAKAPRVYPSLGGFFCAPLSPSLAQHRHCCCPFIFL